MKLPLHFWFNTQPAFSPLERRVSFFSSEPPADGGGESDTAPDQDPKPAPDSAPQPGGKPGPGNSAEARINELTKNRDAAEKRAAEAEAKLAEIEAKKKEEAGEFKNLYEESKAANADLESQLKAQQESNEAMEASLKAVAEKQLESIPEAKRELAQKLLAGKTSAEQLAILPDLVQEFGGSDGGFGGNLPGGSGKPPAGDADLEGKKARHNELLEKTRQGTISPAERMEMTKLTSELSESFAKQNPAGAIEYDPQTGRPKL